MMSANTITNSGLYMGSTGRRWHESQAKCTPFEKIAADTTPCCSWSTWSWQQKTAHTNRSIYWLTAQPSFNERYGRSWRNCTAQGWLADPFLRSFTLNSKHVSPFWGTDVNGKSLRNHEPWWIYEGDGSYFPLRMSLRLRKYNTVQDWVNMQHRVAPLWLSFYHQGSKLWDQNVMIFDYATTHHSIWTIEHASPVSLIMYWSINDQST